VEALPGPGQLWLADRAGDRYTAELRVVAVDARQQPRRCGAGREPSDLGDAGPQAEPEGLHVGPGEQREVVAGELVDVEVGDAAGVP